MFFDLKRSLATIVLGASLAISAAETRAQTGAIPAAAPPSFANNTAAVPTVKPVAATVTTATNVTTIGGNATEAKFAGLSTVNPVSILGNGFGGFPVGFHPHHCHQPNCRNVIDQLIRHCIGNRLFGNNGQHQCGGPGVARVEFVPVMMFPPGFPRPVLGELELLEVNLVTDGTATASPLYRVTFRNNSQIALRNFHVSLVAVLGVIHDFSPNASVNIPLVNPGATGSVEIQLPASVMAMGVPTQPLVPFDTLVVAVDSFDNVLESNELNNLAVLKRTGILAVAATPSVSTTTTTTNVPTAMVPPTVPAPPAPAPAAPAPSAPTPPAPAPPAPALEVSVVDASSSPSSPSDK